MTFHFVERKLNKFSIHAVLQLITAITLGLSNARIEATNNKIKLTIRMAYGFRNIDNLISLVLLPCGGLDISLPGRLPRNYLPTAKGKAPKMNRVYTYYC